jgi:hypothetical protein
MTSGPWPPVFGDGRLWAAAIEYRSPDQGWQTGVENGGMTPWAVWFGVMEGTHRAAKDSWHALTWNAWNPDWEAHPGIHRRAFESRDAMQIDRQITIWHPIDPRQLRPRAAATGPMPDWSRLVSPELVRIGHSWQHSVSRAPPKPNTRWRSIGGFGASSSHRNLLR